MPLYNPSISTPVSIANGGTGQTSATTAFNALSPMTTGGDIIYGGTSGAGTRLANGTSGYVLSSTGGTSAPIWAAAPLAIAVTAAGKLPTGTLNGSYHAVIFGTVDNDTNSAYNTTSGLFTAPVNGYYAGVVILEMTSASVSGGVGYRAAWQVQAGAAQFINANIFPTITGATDAFVMSSGVFKLASGQTLNAAAYADTTTPAYSNALAGASLSINLIGTY